MTRVSSAPLATATRAIRLNRSAGRPVRDARTTSSSGPVDPASWSVGTAALTARPTRTYTAPASSSAPNRARG